MESRFNQEDFRIEEHDDPRTFTGELISDAERAEMLSDAKRAERAKSNGLSKTKTISDAYIRVYYETLDSLFREVGKVAYNFKMLNHLKDGNEKARAVAERYNHGIGYYKAELNSHRRKALNYASQYAGCAKALGIAIWQDKDELKLLLNDLVLNPDKRTSLRNIARRAEKRNEILSINEIMNRRRKSSSS